jgi:hypothetical protein
VTRYDDWAVRLSLIIKARRHEPFAWGSNDCMAWAADCVEAQTGIDTLADYRGQYDSAGGALRALRLIGSHKRTDSLMDQIWGPKWHISSAMIGDIVTVNSGTDKLGLSAGICYGRNSFFVGTSEGQHGLVTLNTLSLEHCHKPWAS